MFYKRLAFSELLYDLSQQQQELILGGHHTQNDDLYNQAVSKVAAIEEKSQNALINVHSIKSKLFELQQEIYDSL